MVCVCNEVRTSRDWYVSNKVGRDWYVSDRDLHTCVCDSYLCVVLKTPLYLFAINCKVAGTV